MLASVDLLPQLICFDFQQILNYIQTACVAVPSATTYSRAFSFASSTRPLLSATHTGVFAASSSDLTKPKGKIQDFAVVLHRGSDYRSRHLRIFYSPLLQEKFFPSLILMLAELFGTVNGKCVPFAHFRKPFGLPVN